MRGRLEYQSVPADHPSVLALLAMNPVLDPALYEAIKKWSSKEDFDPMIGKQLLFVDTAASDHTIFVRDMGTGQIATLGYDSEENSYGGYLWSDIAKTAPQYAIDSRILSLFESMSDSPWV